MRAYVGVGSNLGDRWRWLAHAARQLRIIPGISVLRASRVYESAALGPPGQPRYLNAALEIETALPPARLLAALQRIEASALRRRDVRWGARTLDLDLLLYGGRTIRTPQLTVPHPALGGRRFVLEPLGELCPEAVVPGAGATVTELLHAVPPHDMRVMGLFPM